MLCCRASTLKAQAGTPLRAVYVSPSPCSSPLQCRSCTSGLWTSRRGLSREPMHVHCTCTQSVQEGLSGHPSCCLSIYPLVPSLQIIGLCMGRPCCWLWVPKPAQSIGNSADSCIYLGPVALSDTNGVCVWKLIACTGMCVMSHVWLQWQAASSIDAISPSRGWHSSQSQQNLLYSKMSGMH